MTLEHNDDVDRALAAFGGTGFKYRTFGTFALKPKVQIDTVREEPELPIAMSQRTVVSPERVARPAIERSDVQHAVIEQLAAALPAPPAAPFRRVAMHTLPTELTAVVSPTVIVTSTPDFFVTVPLSPAEVADAEEEAVTEMPIVAAGSMPAPPSVVIAPQTPPLPGRRLVREPAFRSPVLQTRPLPLPVRSDAAGGRLAPATSRFHARATAADAESASLSEPPVFRMDWDRQAVGSGSTGRPIARVSESASEEPGLFRRL